MIATKLNIKCFQKRNGSRRDWSKRRELPWGRIEKNNVFEGATGPETRAALFAGRHQFIVYHFMPEPDACRFPAYGLTMIF